jgi:hypothetical protein
MTASHDVRMMVVGPCIVCHKKSEVFFVGDADRHAFDMWMNGEILQVAFNHWTPDQREMLLTGTHSDCWETFKPEDDDD